MENTDNTQTYIVHVETYREAWPMTCTRDITSWKVTAESREQANEKAMQLAWCANESGQSPFKASILLTRETAL